MTEPSWVTEAKKHLGLTEGPGLKDNAEILAMAQRVGGSTAKYYKHDEIPWCGLFTAYCMVVNGFPLPFNPLGALAWNTWGQMLVQPVYGCVGTFHRGLPGQGHVGFVLGQDNSTFTIISGNTGNKVAIERVLRARLAGLRWPTDLRVPTDILGSYLSTQIIEHANEA